MKKNISLLLAAVLACSACSSTTETTPSGSQTYTGSALGIGEVTVSITVEDGKVVDASVDTSNETPGYGYEQGETLSQQIIASEGNSIDGVTGATLTSNAANAALTKAMEEAGLTQTIDDTISFQPGTYEGKALGRIGTITVSVTVNESQITDITVLSHEETPTISDLPLSQIPQEIIQNQSLAVDTVAGATMSSAGVIGAVTDALTQAGGNITALRNAPVAEYQKQSVEDLHTQIVIAGGGMSGLMSAAVAAKDGADVILVEKLPMTGGSLMVAGGGMIGVNSETAPDNIDDSLERAMNFAKEVYANSERLPDYDFMESVLLRTGETIDYIATDLEMPGRYIDYDYLRVMFGDDGYYGAYLANHLAQIALENGAQIFTNTSADKILMEDGKAAGIQVTSKDGTYNIYADKVIIAAGGANGNAELLDKRLPQLADMNIYEEASVGNTGDGYVMLEEAGAKMSDGPIIKSGNPGFAGVFQYTWRSKPSTTDMLIVDAEGKRFANEAPISEHMISWDMIQHASPSYYVIMDEDNMDEDLLPKLQGQDNPNIAVHADTIEELAQKLNMDSATLKNTFDAYQTMCENGEDTEFGKGADHLIPYTGNGGYYAVYTMPGSWGTIGGAIVDTDFHVLDTDGNVIPNLFAVGESATGQLFGDYYLGSWSLGYYSTMGKGAAETAIAELAD